MRSIKGSRRIVVHESAYRWRATGNDGYISISIWPSNNIGPYIGGNLRYHETWLKNRDGSSTSAGDQIVVTNRIVRRIIEYTIAELGYDPDVKGAEVNLKNLDRLVDLNDAIRATKTPK